MQYQRKSNPKRVAIIIVSIATLVGLAFLVYFFLLRGNSPLETPSDTTSSPRSTNDIDYSGPSSEDILNSQNGKKNDENTTNNTPADNVMVGITFADIIESNLEIRAFTPSVIEGSGTCTAILTKNNETVQKSSLAFVDASSSQCRPIYINIDEFPSKGVWSLKVEYSSPGHQGTSDSLEVTV